MISDHQTRNTEERQRDSSLSFIFKNSHTLGVHTACCFSSVQLAAPLAMKDTGGEVKRHRADVKESIIPMDLVSKAVISRFSDLLNDGGKHTPAPR